MQVEMSKLKNWTYYDINKGETNLKVFWEKAKDFVNVLTEKININLPVCGQKVNGQIILQITYFTIQLKSV